MDAPADDTLTGLAVHVAPVPATAPVLSAYESFKAEPSLYAVPVVDSEGRPVGLLNRFKFLELLSQPFAHDLFKHRTVDTVMDASPLIVDEHVPPDQLSHRMVDDGTRYIFDGFIVTRDGRYLGIGIGHSLMRYITERKHATLFHLAHHDSLTGIPNRQLFNDRLTQALAHARRTGARLGVLYVDVDRFKSVNDGMGHAIGDRLLKAIAHRLMSNTRAEDTVARLGGDEFAVILPQLNGHDHGEIVARKLLEALREPHKLEQHVVNVSCSLGLAVYPADGVSQEELLRAADAAVYHAKQFRNTFQLYSAELKQAFGAVSGFASVKRALDGGHLSVAYQPQVFTGSRAVHGLEALVRWSDPERGAMPTADFIRMAEDAGLIDRVTNYVLGEAASQMMAWRRAGLVGHLSLAVNVSGVELRDGACISTIERHLRETGFPPQALEIEITESTAMLPGASTTAVLKELTAMGIRLSIDDFGTGYSSLARLRHLPVHALKIDRAFVDDVDRRDARTLARAIILMAHSLGLSVTAEGVETSQQLRFLERHGCDKVQGYYICSPLKADQMTSYLSTFVAH